MPRWRIVARLLRAVGGAGGRRAPISLWPEAASEEVAEVLRDFKQADVLEIPSLPIVDAGGITQLLNTPLGKAVVISQTCDLVQKTRVNVQLAPLVKLEGQRLADAKSGRRPRYVAVPGMGDAYFADLDFISTVEKGHVVHCKRTSGLEADSEIREFARAVGRRFSRFPFPDEVVPWFQPLETVVQKKHDSLGSAEGRVLNGVDAFRVTATSGWKSGPPYSLTLTVIVKAGVLPTFADDDIPEIPSHLGDWLRPSGGPLVRKANAISERLERETDPVARYYLWLALGEAWGALCRPKARYQGDQEVLHAVTAPIDVDVVTVEDYRLSDYRKSEELDLDHLSDPLPE